MLGKIPAGAAPGLVLSLVEQSLHFSQGLKIGLRIKSASEA